MTTVYFFKPEQDNGEFSNWYVRSFNVDGLIYISAEQYLMAGKAALFRDDVAFARIMETTSQAKMKAEGRRTFR